MKTSKLTKSILAVIAIVMLGGSALGQEWTPDKG